MTTQARSLLLILIALCIAGFTAFAVKSRMAGNSEKAVAANVPEVTRILTAKRDIAAGSFVQNGTDLEFTTFPLSGIQPFHLKEGVAQAESYNGAVARRTIKAGEPVTDSILIKPGSGGFMAAVLEAGMRAVSIAVTATSGNAGFVFPGDRVDLIVTHKVTVGGSQQNAEESIVSETFVHDARVVAVDQMLDNPENKAILAKTVTVEVTPQQAEKIAVAAEVGKISVALRSLAKGEKEANEPDFLQALSTSDRDVSPTMNRNGPVAPSVRLMRGQESEQIQFYKGNSHVP